MRSLEYRTGVDFYEALRCVQYRTPRAPALDLRGVILSIGLRYGLVGSAAIKHLITTASPDETPQILGSANAWPQIVADHFRLEVESRLGAPAGPELGSVVADLTREAVGAALPLMRRSLAVEDCLNAASKHFIATHRREIPKGWNPLARAKAMRAFGEEAAKSVGFAKFFFERRQFDVPEVPEIALLGE